MMVIVTELLLGGTLRKYLVSLRPKRLDIRLAVGFALDIARAMECLHSHGIIHRDLKPGKLGGKCQKTNRNFCNHICKIHDLFAFAENLILSADHKTVKLADFGLAREESLTEMMTAETGTYRWMAPEVTMLLLNPQILFFLCVCLCLNWKNLLWMNETALQYRYVKAGREETL